MPIKTTAPVEAGDTTNCPPEFGRLRDIERMFGLRRGTVYNLLNEGKIRGCLLRIKGQTSGVRLIELDSVRQYIAGCMKNQETH